MKTKNESPRTGDVRTKVGFVGAVCALVILYFASGSPIPLYSIFQERMGLTHADLSMASMWYLLGTVIPLLFMSRISDHLGRRPATVMILMVSMSGALTFAYLNNPSMLMMGRLIQGIASGLGSSTIAAYVVDLSAEMPRWVGPTITSSAPTLGLSVGAFVSGGVLQYSDVGSTPYFQTVAVMVAVIAVVVLFARETVDRKPGLARSLVPHLTIPKNCVRLFAASAMIFVGTWALGGFSQSFSATIASEQFGIDNPFIAAGVFTSLLLPNAVGGFFANRFEVRQAQHYGMGTFMVCTSMMWVSLAYLDSLVLFVLFSIASGFAQGICFTGSVSEIISRAGKENRAATFSTIYLTSYGGAAIPNLVVGMVPGMHANTEILSWYVMLIIVMFVIMMVLSARPYPVAETHDVPLEKDD